jgi:hypothetical protein
LSARCRTVVAYGGIKDRHGSMVAVVAKPSGTPFGVMEWAEPDCSKQPK